MVITYQPKFGLISNSFQKYSYFKTYICIVCGFVYDEAEGRTEDGIAPGTLWADVPENWTCPDCGVTKADFEVVAI
ncbi:MAG: rubredoxin [Betaproteobacteria bacterium]|nr:rubredoxin [Betaproteobacteria bacterium]